MIAWHMGALHAYEKYLTLGLAFGPFLLLAVVIWLRRRADLAEEAAEAAEAAQTTHAVDPVEVVDPVEGRTAASDAADTAR